MIEVRKPENQSEIALLQEEIKQQQVVIDYLMKLAAGEVTEKDEQD